MINILVVFTYLAARGAGNHHLRRRLRRHFRPHFPILSKIEMTPKISQELKFWRTILRPLAAIFPFLYLFFDRKFMLIFIGSIALAFLLLDIVRLLSRKTNLFLFKKPIFFKQKEIQTLSSF